MFPILECVPDPSRGVGSTTPPHPRERLNLSTMPRVGAAACAGFETLGGMSIQQLFRMHHGLVTRTMLRAAGLSNHHLRRAVADGSLVAIGRDRIALPSCPPELARAAQMGAKVACISAAALIGLWVLDDGRLHVVTRAGNGHFAPDSPDVRVHWARRPLPGDSPAIEGLHNVLRHVASCRPLDEAVAVFDSAVRQHLISLDELARLARLRGGRFRTVVEYASALSDSGLESLTRVRLARAGIPCREQVIIDGHPVDLLIGRLVIQLDGGHHTGSGQLARDRAQDRRLQRMGYRVLRFGYADIIHDWPNTFAEITAALAHDLHRTS
ncbi:DUF559 domain-containing protein [Agromyces intestinalis]|uniref:DUF559 domain-containing protein n=1 Tax=Agromyces intestinalis TaxID=2592652 RepID=A0A5C1YIB9_9MICO|nr:type IV toxin-antitoxin system AbiEi family antitoxin domain-containing protein [Agromyces intestinalis]QEO15713.1 DUF559 domain-containing protein [Agromyces intestinalis]